MNINTLRKAKKEHQARLEETLKNFSNQKSVIKTLRVPLGDRDTILKSLAPLKLSKARGVYVICTNENLEKMKTDLKEFRLKRRIDKREAVPRPNDTKLSKHGCMYVGMVRRSTLYKRLLQHLDTTIQKTGALKLALWHKAKFVTVYYIEIDNEHVIEEYEKALWNYLQPALGKL